MPFHLYKAWNEGEEPRGFGVRVWYDEDHWVSLCQEVDAGGEEIVGGVHLTARFCGVTAEQAHRQMVEALEASYDSVVPTAQEVSS